jgi:hypothetical protein
MTGKFFQIGGLRCLRRDLVNPKSLQIQYLFQCSIRSVLSNPELGCPEDVGGP